MNCKCKIRVSLSINDIFIACISWGQLYKNLHLRFKRAVTIVGTTLIKIWIHPQNWQQTLVTTFLVHSSKGLLNQYQLWYLALEIYGGNINIIQIVTIYWCFYHMICESFANIFKWISNEFIHICYHLALNGASFSISQC